MTSDLQTLLAAIVSDPTDDTARLAYADCLQEHGNTPRAEFIRFQVEAERLHPHSNARGALEDCAQILFTEHWREWWAEVCEAVGLPADSLGAYRETGYAALAIPSPPSLPRTNTPEYPINFRRGFPEAVAIPALSAGPEPCGTYLARWATVSPLTELVAVSAAREKRYAWPEGELLRTVRQLTLNENTAYTVHNALASAHLEALEHLTLRPTYYVSAEATDDGLTLAGAHAARLRHLATRTSSSRFVEWSAQIEPLAALESLELLVSQRPTGSSNRPLETFANSPHCARVRQLALKADYGSNDLLPLLQSPSWNRLRYLAVNVWIGGNAGQLDAFRQPDELSGLEELRIVTRLLTTEAVRNLAHSPLLKRVKHFALSGTYDDGRVFLPLVDAVDPARIETFAVAIPNFPERAANALRAKFGDRFRVLPS